MNANLHQKLRYSCSKFQRYLRTQLLQRIHHESSFNLHMHQVSRLTFSKHFKNQFRQLHEQQMRVYVNEVSLQSPCQQIYVFSYPDYISFSYIQVRKHFHCFWPLLPSKQILFFLQSSDATFSFFLQCELFQIYEHQYLARIFLCQAVLHLFRSLRLVELIKQQH